MSSLLRSVFYIGVPGKIFISKKSSALKMFESNSQCNCLIWLPQKMPASERLMWDVLSCPLNEPLLLSDRTRWENSFQISVGEERKISLNVMSKEESLSVLVWDMSVSVCAHVCVLVHACVFVWGCGRVGGGMHACTLPSQSSYCVAGLNLKQHRTSKAG